MNTRLSVLALLLVSAPRVAAADPPPFVNGGFDGALESGMYTSVSGWACSTTPPSQGPPAFTIEVYIDGPVGVGQLLGELQPGTFSKSEVAGACFGNAMVGWSGYLVFPSSRGRSLWAYAKKASGERQLLPGSPLYPQYSCGYLDDHGNRVNGWTCNKSDFDGDRISDFLWRNTTTGDVAMQKLGSAGQIIYSEPNLAWRIVGTGDHDGDGKADILWRNDQTGQVVLQLMNGFAIKASQFIYQEPNLHWQIIGSSDHDGDGKADILWRNDQTGQVFLQLMNGFAIKASQPIYQEPNTHWKIVGTGDYNGDRKADLLWHNDQTGEVFLHVMDVFTIKDSRLIYQEPNTHWKIVSTDDYNGDLRSDLLWHNDQTGQVFIHLLDANGTGAWIRAGQHLFTTDGLAWRFATAGDYNVDGRTDLLFRNYETGQVLQVLMDASVPTGSWIKGGGVILQELNLAWQIIASS